MRARSDAPERLGALPKPDDPLAEIKARLAQFLLALIQAFLRTGYYTPNHPQARTAKVGLYEDFQKLFTAKDELTFLVRDDPKGINILIEGVLPEAQYLTAIMPRGMAEMYLPKFVKFIENKDLVSLTLKNTMTREEFTGFVDVMGEPTFVETREQTDKERFTRTLREKGIFHISYIYKEELLGAKRNIPWRARIALSRLRKDFKMIPFFVDLSREDLKKVRRQIIQDVARPVQDPEVVYPILSNTELAETNEIKEAEIDDEIVACLSAGVLQRVSERLLKETEQGGPTAPAAAKATGLARRFAASLNERDVRGRDVVLEGYFKLKLISFDQLPKAAQHKIKIDHLTEKFLRCSSALFQNLDSIQHPDRYLQLGQSLAIIIPELIRRDRYDEVLKIIDHLDHHAQEKRDVASYAEKLLDEISKSSAFHELKSKFLLGRKDLCEAIVPIFIKMRRRSLAHLLTLVKASKDHLVRKMVCEIVVQIDTTAVGAILHELQREKAGIGSTLDVIRILGEIRWGVWNQPVAHALKGWLTHENPHVREEALAAYCKARGLGAERRCLALLNDPDVGVQKRAIQCLAAMRSRQALDIFLVMLKRMEDGPQAKDEQLEARLFSALGLYENIERFALNPVEDLILHRLDRHLGAGALKFLTKKKDSLSDEAVAAICETLGKIGSGKSCAILQKLGKQDGSWKEQTEGALARIAERTRQQAHGNFS